jgi:transcriptional regulator with XRE-family HTH domain
MPRSPRAEDVLDVPPKGVSDRLLRSVVDVEPVDDAGEVRLVAADQLGEPRLLAALLPEDLLKTSPIDGLHVDIHHIHRPTVLSSPIDAGRNGSVNGTLGQRLRTLREARGLSRSLLSRATVQPGDEGVAEITIKTIENGKGGSAETLVKLARALDVPESHFPEIQLARARRLFDERAVGLEAALANYDELTAIFPGAGRVDRLIETLEDRPDPAGQAHDRSMIEEAAAAMRRLREALVRERAQGSTSPEAPQPPAAADQPTAHRRRRRPAS